MKRRDRDRWQHTTEVTARHATRWQQQQQQDDTPKHAEPPVADQEIASHLR